MKVTIKDIARECGVSVATVSLALSGKSNRISQATRQKVIAVAEKYKYTPNNAAVSLVKQKSRMITMVSNDLTNPHISAIVMAVSRVLEKNNCGMISRFLESEPGGDRDLIYRMSSENMGAVIWAKSLEIMDEQQTQQLDREITGLGVPVMTMDQYRLSCPGIDVCFDYREGGYLAARHLLELGHRRIGCVAGTRSFQVTQDRLDGYRQALAEFSVEYDPELIYYGNYTMNSGYEAFPYLMGQKVTAIFSMNDEMAFGLYRAARNYGVKIPQDISVIGFDNVPFADVMEVPLTTIRVPVEKMGQMLGEKAVEFIDTGKTEREKIVYRPQLMLRASTRKITR